MAGLSSLRFKSFNGCLKAVQAFRGTTNCVVKNLNVHQVQYRVVSGFSSSGNLTSGSLDKNVVYSRHEDFRLVDQTVVQRIFDRASLWPNLIAMVRFEHPVPDLHNCVNGLVISVRNVGELVENIHMASYVI